MCTPYKLLLQSERMIDYSYTCDALGGNAALVRDMMFESESASDFIDRFNNSPLKEFYDDVVMKRLLEAAL